MLNLDGTKIGLERHAERLRAWMAGERVAPITMDMALTQRCQMECRFCYAGLQKNPSDPIPWETWADFLDDCKSIGHAPGEGVKAISLVSDGESTLSKSYYPFIARCRELGIDVASGTNGEALKRDMMPMLVDSLTYLRINLNSAYPSINSWIMGTREKSFWRVVDNVRELVRLKRERGSKITIGLQMVLMPDYSQQVVPLAKFGRELGVDYLVIKHCSDDEAGRLGVNYDWYRTEAATALLHEAEAQSTDTYSVQVKWSKLKTGQARTYSRCYATPLHLQISGSGVVAPCGSFFSPRYRDKWIGDLKTSRFRDIWASERYIEIMALLRSDQFDPRTQCATLCLQDKTNEALYGLIDEGHALTAPPEGIEHPNFI